MRLLDAELDAELEEEVVLAEMRVTVEEALLVVEALV